MCPLRLLRLMRLFFASMLNLSELWHPKLKMLVSSACQSLPLGVLQALYNTTGASSSNLGQLSTFVHWLNSKTNLNPLKRGRLQDNQYQSGWELYCAYLHDPLHLSGRQPPLLVLGFLSGLHSGQSFIVSAVIITHLYVLSLYLSLPPTDHWTSESQSNFCTWIWRSRKWFWQTINQTDPAPILQ